MPIMNTSQFTDFTYKTTTKLFYGNYLPEKTLETRIYRNGNFIIISNDWGFYERIEMKNTFWDYLTLNLWTMKVNQAKREAFKMAYTKKREEEMLDYQVNQFKN